MSAEHDTEILRLRKALETTRDEAIEECAKVAESHLIDWSCELAFTSDQYLVAVTDGTFNGRKLREDQARSFSRDFHERAGAVNESARHTAQAIRSLKDKP